MHTHRARPELQKTTGWTGCVTPSECATHPGRQSAHGNVIYIDYCACGAQRKTESNGGHNRGPWGDAYEFWTDGGDQDEIYASSLSEAAGIAARLISRGEWADGAWGKVKGPDGQMEVRS
jgi:hypothetical protein